MDEKRLQSCFKEFDQLGQSLVRSWIEAGHWLPQDKSKHGAAIEWARLKDAERALAASKIRDEREEETLKMAEEANRIASSALRSLRTDRIIAISAVIIAAIAASDKIIWCIQWFLHKIKIL